MQQIPECQMYLAEGPHRRLYTFSPDDYEEIAGAWGNGEQALSGDPRGASCRWWTEPGPHVAAGWPATTSSCFSREATYRPFPSPRSTAELIWRAAPAGDGAAHDLPFAAG